MGDRKTRRKGGIEGDRGRCKVLSLWSYLYSEEELQKNIISQESSKNRKATVRSRE